MTMRTQYAKFAKRVPALFDVSKRISRLIENPDPIYECLKEFCQSRDRVSFLQIGSNDGISQDPLREFIVRHPNWEGCLVEPLPHLFAKLKQNYRYLGRKNLRYENIAVSDRASELSLFRIKNEYHAEFPSFVDQIASLNKSHLLSVFPNHPQIDEKIEVVHVKTRPITEVVDSFRQTGIDLLHLDVEGHEAVILRTFPFHRCVPQIIIFEAGHLFSEDRKAVYDLLSDKGYTIYDVAIDAVALMDGVTRRCSEPFQRGGV